MGCNSTQLTMPTIAMGSSYSGRHGRTEEEQITKTLTYEYIGRPKTKL